jgi:adenylosuccinate lyase
VEQLTPYLSEEAFVKYKSMVEAGLARAWAQRGIISEEAADAIVAASEKVTAAEVYEEEAKTNHDIIAQVNMIKSHLRGEGTEAEHAVHRAATSYDIVDTANSARYRDAFYNVIIPDLILLETAWIKIAREERDTLQIGRTHLQHAEPVTFGFAMASFVSRFGERILHIKESVDNLEGKFSGAVGTYGAASLFIADPITFEKEVLGQLNLKPTQISTQITQPEPVVDMLHSVMTSFGVVANWAYDLYNLQRPEIAEIGQPRGKDISRSSTMPNKANPVGLENIISLYKESMPNMVTTYLDQISFHQRDLTNSASQRFIPETLNIFDYAIRRATRISSSLSINRHNMQRNFDMSSGYVTAEPLQLLLSSYGLSDAHKLIGELSDAAQSDGRPVFELAKEDEHLSEYLRRISPEQEAVLSDASKYIGCAPQKVDDVTDFWEQRIQELSAEIEQVLRK